MAEGRGGVTAAARAAGVGAGVTVGLLGAAGFVVTADGRAITPLLPILAADFRADVGTAGLIVTAYTLPYGLFQLLYGPLGDRVGKLRVMAVALALFALGTGACALAPTLPVLGVLRFLTGSVAAAMISLAFAYIGDRVPYERRQATLGQFLTWTATGTLLSTSIGGLVGDFLHWRALFVAFSLSALLVLARLIPAARRDDSQSDRPTGVLVSLTAYLRLLREAGPRLVIAAVFVEGLFFFGGYAYLGAFLRHRFELPYFVIGLVLSGFGLGNLAYTRVVLWLVRRLGENGLVLVGALLLGGCFLALVAAPTWWLFVPVCGVMGFGFSMLHGTLQTRATELAPAARGTAVALFAFSLFVGQGLGAAVLGAMVDRAGYEPMLGLTGVALAALGGWLVWATRRLRLPG